MIRVAVRGVRFRADPSGAFELRYIAHHVDRPVFPCAGVLEKRLRLQRRDFLFERVEPMVALDVFLVMASICSSSMSKVSQSAL
jgi:hypothetical protein